MAKEGEEGPQPNRDRTGTGQERGRGGEGSECRQAENGVRAQGSFTRPGEGRRVPARKRHW